MIDRYNCLDHGSESPDFDKRAPAPNPGLTWILSPTNRATMSELKYRPLSVQSVVAFFTSVVSVAAFLFSPIIVFAIASIIIAVASIWSISRYDLSGIKIAVAGIYIAGSTLICAPAWHYYLFTSESLPDHIRVDFAGAKIGQSTALDAYANKAICIKGYVLPPSRVASMRTIHLSPDGDMTKPDCTITVRLPSEWEYQYAPISVSGVLTVIQDAKDPVQRYVLVAKAIHHVNTSHGIVRRVEHGC